MGESHRPAVEQKNIRVEAIGGETIDGYIERFMPALAFGDVQAEFLGASFLVPQGSSNEQAKELWQTAHNARMGVLASSPEGMKTAEANRSRIVEVQSKIDSAMEGLASLDFSNSEAVLAWLKKFMKVYRSSVGANVDKQLILKKFVDSGYLPQRYPDDKNKNEIGRLLSFLQS